MDKIKRNVIIFAVLVALGRRVYQYLCPYNPSPQTLAPSQQEAMNKINAEMKLLIEDVTLCYSDAAMQKNNVAQNENRLARAVVVLSF